jgi:hypothetical protein
MTAAHVILARAEAAGVTVEADGDRLRLRAAVPPPPTLLHDMAGAKADLLDLLAERAATFPDAGTAGSSRRGAAPGRR